MLERRSGSAEGKEEGGQPDSPRLESSEGAHASRAPHQRSITALFKKAAAATAKTSSSTAAAEGSGAKGWGTGLTTAEAQQLSAEPWAKPQALEHGSVDNRRGPAPEAQATPAVSTAGHLENEGSAAAHADLPAQLSSEGVKRRPRSASQSLGSPPHVQSQPHADSMRQQAKVDRILERASPQTGSGSAAPRQAAGTAGYQSPKSSPGTHAVLSEQSQHDEGPAAHAAVNMHGQKHLDGGLCTREAQAGSLAPSEGEQAGRQMLESGGSGNNEAQAADNIARPERDADALCVRDKGSTQVAISADSLAAPQCTDSLGSEAGRPTCPGRAEHVDQRTVGQPQQEKHAEDHLQRAQQAGQKGARQVDEVVPNVDVAEQRRIMRDIWLRQNISRGSPKVADRSHGGTSMKRRLKQEGEPGSASDPGAKQLRINAMFRAPAK